MRAKTVQMGASMETERKIENSMDSTLRIKNEMQMNFDALSENEAFARLTVSAFVMPLNPTVEEISDIKTAVSEAVTNAIIHGYDRDYMQENCREEIGKVYLYCRTEDNLLYIEIKDTGKGIDDVAQAMEPLFTTRPELERSGMGFAFMEAFMDDLEVESEAGCGTLVRMCKKIGVSSWIDSEE